MRAMILACILLAVGALSQARGQNTGTLTGFVADSLGKPVRGATIRVLDLSPARGAVSRENGSFIIPNLPCGIYSIQVTAIGYKVHSMNDVAITDGGMVEIEACLQASEFRLSDHDSDGEGTLSVPARFGTVRSIIFPR